MTHSALLRRLAVGAVLLFGIAPTISASEIVIGDAKSQPESLTVGPGGALFVGSASTPLIYRVTAGASIAEKFVDVSGDGPGTFFLGVLADVASGTLWACELMPMPDAVPARRHTALRGFDLSTGAPKLRWNLPGENSTCNDFAIGPDKALMLRTRPTGRFTGWRRESRRRNCTWNTGR